MLDWSFVRATYDRRSPLRLRGAPSIAVGVTPHLAFDETCRLLP
jgi:hypothetical protein